VNGFWSITDVDKDYFLVPNPNQSLHGEPAQKFKTNPDGSIDL